MKFDSAALLEEILWDLRLAEEPRAADRALIQRLFNGAPPFDEATADENNIQVNINDLEGANVITNARRQWNNAFLKPANYYTAQPDTGPGHKRQEWSQIFTKNGNRLLKRSRAMIGQARATGANTVLHGVGPTMWPDRRSVVPKGVPVGSLLIPSETEIDDFEDSLPYFAVFREWNYAQLWDMTHGPKVDPGWNMPLVRAQLDYIADELRKSPNALAYQYMPERIEELIKQDKGFFGSDAVPTVDVWDFYFREEENGKGWYRRILLDWGVGANLTMTTTETGQQVRPPKPTSKNNLRTEKGEEIQFLYSSAHRPYAASVGEILHCQFGDCSPYAPVKYHSMRALGWLLYGICDMQNRLHCKFNEAVFEQLMWFFQSQGNTDFQKLKKANFEHFGVIPQGIKWLTANERYSPPAQLVEMAFARNQQLIQSAATAYTQDYEKSAGGQARTATETMALVNAASALAAGVIEMGYTYEAFKYREIVRRLCLKNSRDRMAIEFRKRCLADGLPPEMLDADKWEIEPEKVVGGGNKTVQMGIVQFLQGIRKNLNPHGQRLVDNISISAATEIPELAAEMAPLSEDQPPTRSVTNAQQATGRIMLGMQYALPEDAVYDDFALVWMNDLGFEIQKILASRRVPTQDELLGMLNMIQHIKRVLTVMGKDKAREDRQHVRSREQQLSKLANHVRAFLQQFKQQQQKMAQQAGQAGGNGRMQETQAKVAGTMMQANAKVQIAQRNADAKTRQKELQFQANERREDQRTAAQIRREGTRMRHQLMGNRLMALAE